MAAEPIHTAVDVKDSGECARCGALVAETGIQRHEAWHEFIESSITGLTADLATLQPAADR